MRYLTAILAIILFASSCVTQRKVDRWLNEHPLYEARRCAEKFPAVTTGIDVKVDSTDFKKALEDIEKRFDTLIPELDGLFLDRNGLGSITVPGRDTVVFGGSGGSYFMPGSGVLNIPSYQYTEDPAAIQKIQRQIAQLRDLIRRLPPIVIDSTKTVKDSAEYVKLTLEAQLYRDSSNYYKGQSVYQENRANAAIKRLNGLRWGIASLVFFAVFVLLAVLRSKGLLSWIPINFFQKFKRV